MNSRFVKPWNHSADPAPRESHHRAPTQRDAGASDIRGPRVFVIQNTLHKDRQTQALTPKFDLSPAREFGHVIELLSASAAPFNPDGVVTELKEKLRDFCDSDYLLLVGNPVLIGVAYAIAAQANDGLVRALQWSSGRYVPVEVGGLLLGQEGVG